MDLQHWLGELSSRAKTGVRRARRRRVRGELPLVVAEVMSRDVRTCRLEDTLAQPAAIMWERDCGIVPVLDAAQRVAGVITDRDICMAALTQGQPLQAIAVSTAMSPHVYATRPEDSVDVAEQMMAEHQVRRLPVMEDGQLVGILSVGDLLRRMVDGRVSNGHRGGRRPKKLGSTAQAAHAHLLRSLSKISQPQPS